ncbi:MAG: peptide deformylase [Ruminococcus sp.]|nr:peptide deformylase [Ruminococcus sp.]HAE52135.1 peptide deformylase [Ruminococcus sp.]
MALRKILTDKDETLHKVCRPVEKFDERLATLLDDMHETLDKAQGLGLAAPQVGICRRIFIMHLEEGSFEVINPEVSKREGKQRVQEGCLSCPDVWGYVTRPMSVHLKAQDRNGNWFEMDFTGLGAQCVCHENDHLDGHVFTEIVEEFFVPEEG